MEVAAKTSSSSSNRLPFSKHTHTTRLRSPMAPHICTFTHPPLIPLMMPALNGLQGERTTCDTPKAPTDLKCGSQLFIEHLQLIRA